MKRSPFSPILLIAAALLLAACRVETPVAGPTLISPAATPTDMADGFGGREVVVDLTVASGPGFEVSPNP